MFFFLRVTVRVIEDKIPKRRLRGKRRFVEFKAFSFFRREILLVNNDLEHK